MSEFRTIDGYPNYKVNRDGVVVNKTTGRRLKHVIDTNGYARVKLNKQDCFYVRRLVCEAFRTTKFEWKDIAVLDHRFRSKKIIKAERMKWGTQQDVKRRDHRPYKLTPKQVDQLLDLRKQGWTQGRLAKKFDISQPAVCNILKGGRRKPHSLRKYAPDQVRAVRAAYKRDSFGVRKVAEKFGIPEKTVWNIVNFVTYKDVK